MATLRPPIPSLREREKEKSKNPPFVVLVERSVGDVWVRVREILEGGLVHRRQDTLVQGRDGRLPFGEEGVEVLHVQNVSLWKGTRAIKK